MAGYVDDPAGVGESRLSDGRLLGWAEWGPPDGVPVLLCPGAGTSRWLGFGAGAVGALGVRLVSVDRPGLGASSLVEQTAGDPAGAEAFLAGCSAEAMWRILRSRSTSGKANGTPATRPTTEHCSPPVYPVLITVSYQEPAAHCCGHTPSRSSPRSWRGPPATASRPHVDGRRAPVRTPGPQRRERSSAEERWRAEQAPLGGIRRRPGTAAPPAA